MKTAVMRERPIVCALNKTQILIMGGVDVLQRRSLNDVFVFGTETFKIDKVAGGGELTFSSRNNASVAISDKKVVALVNDGE